MRRLWLVAVLLCTSAACSAQAPVPLGLERALPGLTFSRPVDLQHAEDGSGRVFVVEQEGVIRVVDRVGEGASAQPFLDLRGRVLFGGEQGLLGLAFHPRYAANGTFYVNYTAGSPRRTVVARYRVDPSDPDRALPGSETVLLEVPQPYPNHNGGQLGFGPDGYLYVALGDGGAGGDPDENGQDRRTLLGAILRLDVDGAAPGRPYAIPPDNPFAGNAEGFREEIYAYGLRNPWRFSFDAETGVLWTGDVGQNAYEEVDVIERGGNYGWDVMEAAHCYEPRTGCDRSGLRLPVWEYPHGEGRSITGGYVYRGRRLPALAGRYVYADYASGKVWALAYDGERPATNTELLDTDLSIAAFGVDAEDELYLLAFDGHVYRFAASTPTGTATPADGRREASGLGAIYPNPSGAETRITFVLARAGQATLEVHDALGRTVRRLADQGYGAGQHAVVWDGRDAAGAPVPSGLYFCRLSTDTFRQTTSLVVRR